MTRRTTTRGTTRNRMAVCIAFGLVVMTACGSDSNGVSIERSDDGAATIDTESDDTTTVPETSVVDPTSPTTETPPPETTETPPPETTEPTTEVTTADTEAPDTTVAMDPGDLPDPMNLPGTDIPLVGPYPFDPDKPAQPFDGLMVATVDDLVLWWTETMPEVFGQEYEPLAGGIFPSYPEKSDYPDNGCFSSYEEVQDNGFYCPAGDFITWDDPGYALSNYEDHGSGAITGLMSHEWGHAIQQRTGVFDIVPEVSTPVVELQADCYSGAWFGHVARGESDLLTFTDADIRSGLLDTALSADPVGSSPEDEGAHGAGFDRVGAFQDGFNLGAAQCAGYIENNPPITEFPFDESYADDTDPGDLPYADLLLSIPEDLNIFWTDVSVDPFPELAIVPFNGDPPACDGLDPTIIVQLLATYCPADGTVLVNDDASRVAVDRVGDFSAGYFLAAAWAEAAQVSAQSALSGITRVLYNDCLVGVWAKSLPTTASEDRIQISPGDLDEAVATAILFADDSSDDDIHGTAYEKIDAFRQGALGGFEGCTAYLG